MLSTLAGIVRLVRLVQPTNAELPICFRPSGRSCRARLLQLKNALFPIWVRPPGRISVCSFVIEYLTEFAFRIASRLVRPDKSRVVRLSQPLSLCYLSNRYFQL